MTTEFFNKIFDTVNISTKEFAKRISVSETTVRNWRSGKTELSFFNQRKIRVIYRNIVSKLEEPKN